MEWTQVKPTETGWYWFTNSAFKPCIVYYCQEVNEQYHNDGDYQFVRITEGFWSEKIQQPEY